MSPLLAQIGHEVLAALVRFGGKADMTLCGNPLLRSLLGVERTSPCALHMSAYDPKRTLAGPTPAFPERSYACYDTLP
jgi:hypothetical protein